MSLLALCSVLFLAWANGANDNFKGVATLYGSGQLKFKPALAWTTVATLAGSLTAFLMAEQLLRVFSGKGLVPDIVVQNSAFGVSVAMGAALTVWMASRFGMPISTTHALVGALVGAGLVLSPNGIRVSPLVRVFLVPLIVSPALAMILAASIYPVLSAVRKKCGVGESTCVCVGQTTIPVRILPDGSLVGTEGLRIAVQDEAVCRREYTGAVFGLNVTRMANAAHLFLGGAVSFARGLNDTPKIVGLLIASAILPNSLGLILVGLAMAVGAVLYGRRVAETMSHRITEMNLGQGMTAAATTAALVIFASRWGLPVSTTHVSCGSLFGIGAVTRQARWAMIRTIISAWLTTLPIAAALAAICAFVIRN